MNRRKYLAISGGMITIAGCSEEEIEPELQEEEEPDSEPQEEEEPEEEEEETEPEPESEEEQEEQEKQEEEPEGQREEEKEQEEEQKETSIEVTVDWDYLEESLSEQAQILYSGFSNIFSTNSGSRITHVGIRVEYPEANAVFTQSTSKSLADDQGIVTLDVPPTDDANIYLTAVEYNEPGGSALLFASESGTQIEEDTANQWVTDDFDWTTTEWFVDEEYEEEYNQGEIHVDKGESKFRLPYYVTYPFHPNQEPTYEQILVRINGRGSIEENTEDYHEYYISANNPSEGEESQTSHSFYPYLVSEQFSLPPARYKIEPTGGFDVIWE